MQVRANATDPVGSTSLEEPDGAGLGRRATGQADSIVRNCKNVLINRMNSELSRRPGDESVRPARVGVHFAKDIELAGGSTPPGGFGSKRSSRNPHHTTPPSRGTRAPSAGRGTKTSTPSPSRSMGSPTPHHRLRSAIACSSTDARQRPGSSGRQGRSPDLGTGRGGAQPASGRGVGAAV
jgi:hypothetical protein